MNRDLTINQSTKNESKPLKLATKYQPSFFNIVFPFLTCPEWVVHCWSICGGMTFLFSLSILIFSISKLEIRLHFYDFTVFAVGLVPNLGEWVHLYGEINLVLCRKKLSPLERANHFYSSHFERDSSFRNANRKSQNIYPFAKDGCQHYKCTHPS